jgi:putative transposase
MARPLRLEYPGAWWHITSRGVERRDIFLDDRDRRRFLSLIAQVIPHFHWRLHAYVLMTNHYHLLVETIDATLSRGMHKIGGDYATWFNARHRRVGHLFQARFKAHLIDSEEYLLQVARYIVRNPVRARLVPSATAWPWSSARATAGLAAAPQWLTTAAILERFDGWDLASAKRLYRNFVEESDGESPWRNLVGQVVLGSADFVARMQQRIDERQRSHEYPRAQRSLRPATVEEVRHAVQTITGIDPTKSRRPAARIAFVELAHSEAQATLGDIGAAVGVGPTGVSYLLRRAREAAHTDRDFRDLLECIRFKIKTAN